MQKTLLRDITNRVQQCDNQRFDIHKEDEWRVYARIHSQSWIRSRRVEEFRDCQNEYHIFCSYLLDDLWTVYGEYTFGHIFDVMKKLLHSGVEDEMMIHNLKFSLYVICLLIIFALLWKKMVTNMQMDIIKALGILNILPTSHLGAHPDFIRDMNKSNLIN